MPYLLATAVIFLIVLLYWLSIQGRRNHPKLPALLHWSYAHRGLHGEGIPENSMAAFQAALEQGYGIELDVHLLRDGGLAVIHDSKLLHTTGAEGNVEDLTTEQLSSYRLEGTSETIPTLSQVLSLFHGKAPIIVELKVHQNNVAPLCRAACDLLDTYEGAYCLESFDPRVVRWLRKQRPDLIRGQLTEDFVSNREMKVPFLLKWMLTHNLCNFYTRPDFLSYRFEHRHATVSNRLLRRRIAFVGWTIRTPEDYSLAQQEGWTPIFESFLP